MIVNSMPYLSQKVQHCEAIEYKSVTANSFMLLFQIVHPGVLPLELHLLRYEPDELSSIRQGLEAFVDPSRQARMRKFHFLADRDRSLLGDILARTLLCKALGVRNDVLSFGLNSHGKPHLIFPEGIQYNVSHSGNWIACGIGTGILGVDVERISGTNLEIADRFFAPKEVHFLRRAGESEQQRIFHEIWTLKESFIKARGLGLSIPLDQFEMVFGPGGVRAFSGGQDTGLHFRLYPDWDPEYAFAACGEIPPSPVPTIWTSDSLVRAFAGCSSYQPAT